MTEHGDWMGEAERELLDDVLSRRIDRGTLIARATALGLSGSALASLIAATPAQSLPRVADRRTILTKKPPPMTVPVHLHKRPGDKSVKIGFALQSMVQFRMKFDRDFFGQAVKELGDSVVDADANGDATVQQNQVDNFLSQGVDVLVIFAVSVDAAGALATEAAKQGVPVVSYNFVITNSKGVSWWVARDNVYVGRLAAQMAVAAKPNGNYVIASGDPATDVAQLKTKGNYQVLNKYKGKIKVVSQQYHQAWDPALGQAQIENALTATHGNIAAIVCNYDGFVTAALQALPDKNKSGKVWIGGEDIYPEVAQAIVEGRAAMSAYTDLRQMARLAAQAAHELGNHRKPAATARMNNGAAVVPGVRVNSIAITKQNMCRFIKAVPGWLFYDQVYANIPKNKRPTC